MRDVRYRLSTIPKGGLEIPIMIVVKKQKASPAAFKKRKELIYEYYTELENIKNSKVQSEIKEQ